MSDKQKVQLSELNRYLVGGAVRDRLLNIDRSDKDWVVVGTTEATMQSLGFRPIGKNFPVFLHPETHEEYALARTERKTGKGYKGFDVDASPTVSLEQDLFRRDLTINAMALDTEDNLIDPFGGRQDLENGLLRHVSAHFSEDPLRVLRVARFAARYHSRGFIVEDSTLELMRELSDSGELDYLVPERVLQEVLSALSEDHPAVFFTVLRVCNALANLFPEINKIYDLRPDIDKPLLELELAAHLTDDVRIRFSVLACLINKLATTSLGEPKDTTAIRKFCRRLKTPTSYRTLAEQVAAYSDCVMTVRKMPASDTVEMLLALNGIRDEKSFGKFLEACSVQLTILHQEADVVRQAIELLRECRNSMRQVDAKSLAKNYEGDKLRDQVRHAYIRSVSTLLEDDSATK